MSELGQVFGFLFIPTTLFTGPEAVPTSAGPTMTRVVTGPEHTPEGPRPKQYLAIVYTQSEATKMPWLGFIGFVSSENSGWYGQFHMTPTQVVHHFSRGVLMDSLAGGFHVPGPAGPAGPAPDPTDEVFWTSTVNRTVFDSVTYFDFNWVDLFAQHRPSLTPTKIKVTGNPSLGTFKASVVPGAVVSVMLFDTVRVILTSPPQPGLYTFSFSVTTEEVGEVPCVLNLSVT